VVLVDKFDPKRWTSVFGYDEYIGRGIGKASAPKKFIIVVSFCFSVKYLLFKNIKRFQFSFQPDTNNRKF